MIHGPDPVYCDTLGDAAWILSVPKSGPYCERNVSGLSQSRAKVEPPPCQSKGLPPRSKLREGGP